MLDLNEPAGPSGRKTGCGSKKPAERYVRTEDAKQAVAGHETDILDAIGINWRAGDPHIHCPYPGHPDHHPSWRWCRDKALAFCTCLDKPHSIFDVVMNMEAGDFDAAKLRAMEILHREDLIHDPTAATGLTLEAYAEAKQLPIEWLREIGLHQVTHRGIATVCMPYFVADGSQPAIRYRLALGGDKKSRFKWKAGSQLCLYGAHWIAEFRKAGYVVLVEGESDAQTLWKHGIPALGLPGNTNWNEERDAPLLADIPVIYIIVEPDNGGEKMLARFANSAIASRVRVVRLRGAKDPSALYLSNPTGLKEAFEAALAEAPALQTDNTTQSNGSRPHSDLPTISIQPGKLHKAADEGLAALQAAGAEFYQRNGMLVRVARIKAKASDGTITTMPGIIPVTLPLLRRALGQSAVWVKPSKQAAPICLDPPKDVVEQIAAMVGEWPFGSLSGVIAAPSLRPDGTLLLNEGYDEATGLVLLGTPKIPPIPDEPTAANAQRALALLENLLEEFPFVDGPNGQSKSVALSMLITPVLRGGIPPAAPIHLVTKPAPGTGGSYLADIASAIATGERCAVMSMSPKPEETEKRLIGAAISGFPIIALDNCSMPLEGDFLCQVSERPILQLRPLGKSSLIRIANTFTMFANGNQASVTNDVVRRTITCGLDANMENPEDREFKRDPLAMVLAERGKYIAACLIIARAYIVAGRPAKQQPLPSFERWSDTVRGALLWLGKADPVGTIAASRAQDEPRQQRAAVFKAWASEYLFEAGVLTSDLIAAAEEVVPPTPSRDGRWKRPALHDALVAIAEQKGVTGSKICPRRLGRWLRNNANAVSGVYKLTVDRSDAQRPRWRLGRAR